MRLGEDCLDVVAESQIVDEVRMSDRLVVVLEAAQFRVEQTEVAEVERSPELRLAHAPCASLVVIASPLVDTHSFAEHLLVTFAEFYSLQQSSRVAAV